MTSDQESWFRLELFTESPNSVAAELFAAGALGVETQDGDTFDSAPIPDGFSRIIAFFESNSEAPEIFTKHSDLSFLPYNDLSWKESWKRYFRPILISPCIIVGPPWEEFEAPKSGHKIIIEPGMAFGTGTHETTQLCGEILEHQIKLTHPRSILDVGCGSGILSIAAEKLGVSEVFGIDNDQTAIEVAIENARLNHSSSDIVNFDTNWPSKKYDIVVANILSHILLSLKESLYNAVAPQGHLILSGITDTQIDSFLDEFLRDNWTIVHRQSMGEWRAAVLIEDK